MNIIPEPVKCRQTKGVFVIDGKTSIYADDTSPAAFDVAGYLAGFLAVPVGGKLKVLKSGDIEPGRGVILLTTHNAKTSLGDEGYELKVTPESVVIRAPKAAGLFYGVQSLLQLMPPGVFGSGAVTDGALKIDCVEIEDQPRFPWRGMMLDVSRHFFTPEYIKRLIDLLAMHKMNVLHMHLTDDGGWRLEIKSHPNLTDTGAWRTGDGKGWDYGTIQFPGPGTGEKVYGGFYTREQMRDLVAYAQAHYVKIVPEIEMPGHSLATSQSYPGLRCKGDGNQRQNVFCAGSDETFKVLEDVLTEVMDLFPDVMIHIGADEVDKGYWSSCERCKARMKSENLANLDELQSYFIKRIEKFVNSKGRRIIGWDEILEGGLAPNAAVMSWRGMNGGIAAANAGHEVVMSPTSHCYLDYLQSLDTAAEPPGIGGHLPLATVYAFEPVPPDLAPEKHKLVLGTQGNVWTEFIETEDHIEYMTFPRLSALSEVAWSPASSRNWDSFLRRWHGLAQRLDVLNVRYRRVPPEAVR
ncbi:MAG: beta-N-acetylhexosaminidase [bacterium]